MIGEIIISIATLAAITALVIWLIMQPQKRVLQIGVPICIGSFTVIFVFYLVAFLVPDDPVFGIPVTFQAFIESFISFTNGIAYSDIVDSEMMDGIVGTFWFETVFWALHMLVIITLAISGFAVFGRKIMDRARCKLTSLLGRRQVYRIFGDTQGALILGENLSKEADKPLVVFYSLDYTEELREDIAAFGGALIEVDEGSRDALAERMRREHPGNVAVFEGTDHARVNGDRVSDLLARKVVHDNPPYRAMGQNGGFPSRPYEAVIIGFGELGQACTKQLVGNAQLSPDGARPRLYVLDRDPIGFERFQIENPALPDWADVEYLEADAYSFACNDALLRIVKATGGPDNVYVACAPVVALTSIEKAAHLEHNAEIKEHVKGILAKTGVFTQERLDRMFVTPCIGCTDIWTSSIILHKGLDERAIRLNGSYAVKKEELEGLTPEQKQERFLQEWEDTPEFHKDSSRASCDFMTTLVAIAGLDPEDPEAKAAFAERIAGDDDLLDGLSRIEHARWCAFHACQGYTPMSEEELAARVDQREAAVRRGDENPLRAHQDTLAKRHASMVAWEALPSLEPLYRRFDEKIASGEATLQGRDTDNVRLVSEIL